MLGPDAVIFEQPEVKKAMSAKRQLTLNWGKGYLTKADTPLTKKQKVGVSSKVGESSKEKHVCLECFRAFKKQPCVPIHFARAKLIDVFLHDSPNMANLALILITITVAAQFPNTYRNVNMLNT